jgi:transcriptional regulator with XRE-family HTH domain
MTIEEVAERLLCSPSKVSRMETGLRGTSQRDIRDLCAVYNVTDPAQCDHLAALAKEGRRQAWWQPYDLPATFATYVDLEAEAAHIRNYEPGVIPGLLQIPAYARAVHEGGIPRLSDSSIEQRVQVRESRQAILTREDPAPPQFRAVIDEAVLHRVVSSPHVMSAALDHMIEICELPSVTVQVLSFAAGAHPALDSTFILLDFADLLPPVVYVEGLVGQMYLDRALDVERYKEIFERLTTISLTQYKSIDLMAKQAAVYKRY